MIPPAFGGQFTQTLKILFEEFCVIVTRNRIVSSSVICLNLGVAGLVVGVVAGLDLEDGEGEHDGHGIGHRDPPRDNL